MIAIFAPLLGILALVVFGARMKTNVRWVALPFPILSFLLIAWQAIQHPAGTQEYITVWQWIPGLGIDFLLLIDGLSLFFALVVSGVGVLIFFYASQYLDDHYAFHNRFYSYLLLFMVAMLGTVFSGNLMLMFVWWEVTGIASFFLIGFLHAKEESRAGARMAFLITVSTGLLFLCGVVLTAQIAGSLNLEEILAAPIDNQQPLWIAAFVLVAIGAFGKSAQFPFFFWLPNAMAAPTPVSAYLHSATMVKLGVFLTARMYPVFSDVELWTPLLTSIGFLTFLIASVFALISHKLKAILAYSTVAALAFFIGFYGLAPADGVQWDLLHILNHVLYKACLFMIVGIVTHCTGVTDIRKAGGLIRRMPMLAVITAIAVASMGGVILTTGFMSKEYILAELLAYREYGSFLPWMPLAAMVTGSVLSVAYCLRIFWHIFMGKESEEAVAHFHAPSFLLQLPPLILAGLTLLFGFFPTLLMPFFETLTVAGLHAGYSEGYVMKIWHGLDNTAFQISMGILASGILLFVAIDRTTNWGWDGIPKKLRLDDAFEWGVKQVPNLGKGVNYILRADSPTAYLPVISATFVALFGSFLLFRAPDFPSLASVWTLHFREAEVISLMTAALIMAAATGILFARRWTTQLIFLSIVGFLITFYFVLYRAPDLAMTQILIEAATLVLILLLLARFPNRAQEGEETSADSWLRKSSNAVIACGVGLIVGIMTYVFGMAPSDPIGPWFFENTLELAYGTNAVNTILVDFRGFDTLLEVSVLLIAGLGILGLLMRRKRTPAEMREGAHGQGGLGMDPKPKR